MMFEIGSGKELSEKDYFSILRISSIMFFVGIFLIANTFAETVEQSYSASVNVRINTGENIVNIMLEGDNRTFSITNSTNSYSVSFKRNASCSDSSASNLSNTISSLTSTCQKITEAYGDASSFYKPLLECTTIKAQCEKEKESLGKDKESLKSSESNYNNCQNEKKNIENQFSACSGEYSRLQSNSTSLATELKNTKSKSTTYLWGMVIAVGVIIGYWYKNIYQKQSKHPTEGVAPPRS